MGDGWAGVVPDQDGEVGDAVVELGEHRYAQGIAYSSSGTIKGPWVQEKEAFKGDNSGHGMLFTTFEGKRLYVVHHAEENGPRKPELYEVDDSGDKLCWGKRWSP